MFGFMGKILYVDLSSQTWQEVKKEKKFYHQYLGGSFLAARLFQDELKKTPFNNAFDPANPLIFATGLFAGENVCGATRVNVFTLSAETTGTYLSQAGGEFGPELKRMGFDALVIKGKADSPLYLKMKSQGSAFTCEFLEAQHLWGKDRVVSRAMLMNELTEKFSLALIGPGGENLVACANIMFEQDHYAGRGGMGAVMGSKNLKAICIAGDKKPIFKDRTQAMAINKRGATAFKKVDPSGFMGTLRYMGTFGLMALNQAAGNLPVRNFKEAFLDSADFENEISHGHAGGKYVGKLNACKACYVACKKRYNKESAFADYTSLAEYESIALLGPNIGLKEDLTDGLRACELCNRLGLDTISVGSMVAWLMDCFEHKVLDEKEHAYSIRFGEGDKACRLIEDIALRKTKIGRVLADGILKAVDTFGAATRPYLRAARGVGFPAHMPRKKPGIGFGYLTGHNPADHMKLEHDWIASDPVSLKAFGLTISSAPPALDPNKVEIAKVTQDYYSLIDSLSLCLFVFGPGNIYSFEEIANMVNAALGSNFSFNDLMKIGEKSNLLQRELYFRLGGKDEEFLPYLKEEIPSGPSKGSKIKESDFYIARKHYNSLWEKAKLINEES